MDVGCINTADGRGWEDYNSGSATATASRALVGQTSAAPRQAASLAFTIYENLRRKDQPFKVSRLSETTGLRTVERGIRLGNG